MLQWLEDDPGGTAKGLPAKLTNLLPELYAGTAQLEHCNAACSNGVASERRNSSLPHASTSARQNRPRSIVEMRFTTKRCSDKHCAGVSGQMVLDCLKPLMTISRAVRAGEIVFRAGDPADGVFYVVSGRFLPAEPDLEIEAGALVGESGLVSPNNRCTFTPKTRISASPVIHVLPGVHGEAPEFSLRRSKAPAPRARACCRRSRS